MLPLRRTSTRLLTSISRSHSRIIPSQFLLSTRHRTYAQESYGNSQSGHPKSSAPNPKVDLEHPGPESPAEKDNNSKNKSSSTTSSSQSSSPSSSSSSSSSDPTSTKSESEGSSPSYPETTQGGSPAINNPGTAPEEKNEDVKKHNAEMEERHERSHNQLDGDGNVEQDEKVEKGFWKDKTGN